MLKKLFKPFYYTVILLSILIMLFYIKEDSFNIDLYSLPLILIAISIEYYGLFNYKDNVAVTLTFSISVLSIIIYGPLIAIIINSIMFIIGPFKNNVKNINKINIYERIKKIIFNISQGIIYVFVSERMMHNLNIDLNNTYDIWKIILVVITYYYSNALLITAIITFNKGKFFDDLLSIKKNYYVVFYFILLTPVLIFNYHDRGYFGLFFILINVFAMQRAVVFYKKWKEQEEEMFKDELTGAYNYRYLTSVIDNNISTKKEFTLITFDIDKFKDINEAYGTIAANDVLKKLVISIKKIIKDDGILCRYSGDKFSVILISNKKAFNISSKILLLTNELISINEDDKIKIGLSIGYYCYTGGEITKEELINKVDKAMFKAKKSNSNVKVCEAV